MSTYQRRFVGAVQLPRHLSEFDVEQFFKLLPEDVVAIRDRFRAYRRLGPALQARQLRIERDNLKEKLANTAGQLERIGKQFDALSRQLNNGQQAVSASVRPLPSATNSTQNKITPTSSATASGSG